MTSLRPRRYSVERFTFTGLLFAGLLFISLPGAATAETITVGGTGSALGTLQRMGKAYMALHPEIKVTILPSLGSGGGIKAVIRGSIDIGLSGRALKDSEKEKAVAVEFAQCPFVLVVPEKNPVSEMSLEQLARIYSGETDSWPDGTPLRLIMRPERESEVDFLKSLGPEMERAVPLAYKRQGMIVALTDQEAADKVGEIPGAFGISTLCQVVSEARPLKIVSLDGVQPTLDLVENGRYPYVRLFRLVTPLQPAPHVQEFIRFILSETGAGILKTNGSLPVKTP